MSKTALTLVCTLLLAVGLIGSLAVHAAPPTTAPTTNPAVDPKPVNKKCPITDEDIDPTVTEVYNGKTYAFCCADCKKTFEKDPAKYAAKAH